MWSNISAGFTPEKVRPAPGGYATYVFALPEAALRK
jgi:hypothetical protein